ncbi:MAG TPA: iron ABC transporter permease, partial [Nonomuraea sp.]|nr:iron ABC transporter permease [Nonomuraea sp.]
MTLLDPGGPASGAAAADEPARDRGTHFSGLTGRGTGRAAWSGGVGLIAVIASLPVLAVVIDAFGATGSDVQWPPRLGHMVITTAVLLISVGAATVVIGGGLAWLVTAYSFPGRGALSWLLVLPLAMPAYIAGFVYLYLLDYPGPIQTQWRAWFGQDAWFPDVHSTGMAAVVLSLCLYPYVYLLARSALLEQAPATYDAARSLGCSPTRALLRVVLPLARPSLMAGAALVMMETLTDFGTVAYFNVETVTVGVYRVWKGTFDRQSATALASLVLAFALIVILAERLARGRARYLQKGGADRGFTPVPLRGAKAWAATGVCSLVLLLAFALPVWQLIWWAGHAEDGGFSSLLDERYLEYLWNSLRIGFIAAAGCVVAAVVMAHAAKLSQGRRVELASQAATVGYAVPGAVVAIGVLIATAWVDDGAEAIGISGGIGAVATGSVIGVVYAYLVRFMAPAYQSVDASFAKMSSSLTGAALSLGSMPRQVLTRVHLPLARAGVAVAVVLVLVDALKELPIVLLLRPFGFTTLSIQAYQEASEARWESAATP